MIIIDGHNLLHCVRKNIEELVSLSDVELCEIISEYLSRTRQAGEIVFDGAGPQDKSAFDRAGGLDVFFAGAGSDADTVIEGKISSSSAPKRIIIVSSDRRLRAAAKSRKAGIIKSEHFWADVEKQLSRKRRPKEPKGKRGGLTEGETDQWMKLFDLES